MVKYLADFNFNNFAFDYESAGNNRNKAHKILRKYIFTSSQHYYYFPSPPLR